MKNDKKTKIGLIGLGVIGMKHLECINESKNMELGGICTNNIEKVKEFANRFNVPGYTNYKDLLNHDLDAILIAVPHYAHTPIAVEAFKKGMHVLTEKPVGVHVNDINKMINAYNTAKAKKPDLVFAAMFQQRTLPQWIKIKELLESGELGKLTRVTWIITDWYRTQAYFDMSSWRATWKGEGGGVLINQSVHQLDLYQWLFGMPNKITGFVELGKHHEIETEDEVTAVMKHSNGMVGHFITNTFESPGTNRLEIVGEKGKLVFEKGELVFYKNKHSMLDHIKKSKEGFEKVKYQEISIKLEGESSKSPYTIMIENFGDTVNKLSSLIAPALEGLNSVEIANAILLSHFTGNSVDLPINGDLFEKKINELIESSD